MHEELNAKELMSDVLVPVGAINAREFFDTNSRLGDPWWNGMYVSDSELSKKELEWRKSNQRFLMGLESNRRAKLAIRGTNAS